MATATNTAVNAQTNYSNAPTTNVVSKEYYVKVPNRTKKRYHALKFHTSNVDMASWSKAEMARDMTNQLNQRPDWETMPKKGEGSEFGREAKEMAKRRRFGGHAPKKINPEDQPWVLSNKGGDKSAKQYIGKKSVSENSSYFVFIKCADGGFEAWPLEDWYSFAPHKTYKTLNHEEAEEEYKRRNKVLNKYTIMANKRKVDNVGDDEEGEEGPKTGISSFGFTAKSGKDAWVSDGEEDSKKKKKKNYKSSNLSDDDDEDKDDGEDELAVTAKNKKKTKRKDIGSDDEVRAKEDSDEGDHDGIEKDYSSSDSDLDDSGPETSKFEEKYQQKGIDEEEAIKAQNKSDDSESEEDEDLTEEGKLYKKKLMAKDKDENESDEFDELFKGKGGKDEDSKDSSSSFDESDLESDIAKQKRAKLSQSAENNSKLKRKASDESLQSKPKKKATKNQTSSALTHDESSSSSSTSAPNMAKSTKTAAVIAAAKTAAAANTNKSSGSSNTSAAKVSVKDTNNSGLSEEEVKRYLSRKPMTSKELLQKFKSKTQNTMTNQQLLDSLRAILDKLKAKMIEKNGVKYLSLP